MSKQKLLVWDPVQKRWIPQRRGSGGGGGGGYSEVVVGTTSLVCDEGEPLVVEATNPLQVSGDETTDTVTFSLRQGPGSGLDADTVDGQHASAFAPASHDHDSRYAPLSHTHPDATTTTSGFMSAADKAKLDSLPAGAEPNQDAFSAVRVGTDVIAADQEQDTLEFVAGANIALSADTSQDRITFSVHQGPGSGLDADTVDGQHAAAFAPATHTHPDATTTSSGFMSAADKAKLDGIQAGAEPNQDAFAAVRIGSDVITADAEQDTLELVAGANIALTADPAQDRVTIAVTQGPGSGLDADTLDGQHASAFASATHDHDGQYAPLSHTHPDATTTTSGFMSAADKAKLDSIAAGAEVNQNAFSVVRVGATDIVADAEQDVLELRAGAGITLTPDASNDRVTVSVNQGPGSGLDADTVDGQHASAFAPVTHDHDGVYAPVSHTHPDATTTTSGFMSAADKVKLDGIEAGAEVNQDAFAVVRVGTDTILADAEQDTLELAAGANIALTADPAQDKVTIAVTQGPGSGLDADTLDGQHASSFASATHDHDSRYAPLSHTHPDATTTTSGFMSAADKSKLDSLDYGFEAVKVGATLIEADQDNRTLELVAGNNVTLTPDAANRKITIEAVGGSGGGGSGGYSRVWAGSSSTELVADSGEPLLIEGQAPIVVTGSSGTTNDTVTIGIDQGPGSGLDADTVDGQHASAFALATHMHPDATTTTSGFLSASDKQKLDALGFGFESVKVGTTLIDADQSNRTLELVAGNNITLIPDETQRKVTIEATGGGGGSTASYGVIRVGATDISAAGPGDTFELASGYGVRLTPNATSKTVTIGATLSAYQAYNTSNVNITSTSPISIASVTVPAGTYFIVASSVFYSNSGGSAAVTLHLRLGATTIASVGSGTSNTLNGTVTLVIPMIYSFSSTNSLTIAGSTSTTSVTYTVAASRGRIIALRIA